MDAAYIINQVIVVAASLTFFLILLWTGIVFQPYRLVLALLFAAALIPGWISSEQIAHVRFGYVAINVPLLFLLVLPISIAYNVLFKRLQWKKLEFRDLILLLLALVVACSLPRALSDRAVSASYVFFFPILFYFMFKIVLDTPEKVKGALITCLIAGVLTSIELIIEQGLRRNVFLFFHQFYMHVYEHIYQSGGFLADPSGTGLYLAMLMPVCWWFEQTAASQVRRNLYRFILVLFTIGIIVTYARVAWAGLTLFLIFYLWQSKSKAMNYLGASLASLALAFMILFTFVYLPRLEHAPFVEERLLNIRTAIDRVNMVKDSLAIWGVSPLWGIGYENYRFIEKIYFTEEAGKGPTHSNYTTTLTELGLVGFFLYMTFLIANWRYLRGGKTKVNEAIPENEREEHDYFRKVLLLSYVIYLIGGFGHTTLLSYSLSILLLLLLSIDQNMTVTDRAGIKEAAYVCES